VWLRDFYHGSSFTLRQYWIKSRLDKDVGELCVASMPPIATGKWVYTPYCYERNIRDRRVTYNLVTEPSSVVVTCQTPSLANSVENPSYSIDLAMPLYISYWLYSRITLMLTRILPPYFGKLHICTMSAIVTPNSVQQISLWIKSRAIIAQAPASEDSSKYLSQAWIFHGRRRLCQHGIRDLQDLFPWKALGRRICCRREVSV
jgi:hypothetical protein